MSDYDSNDDNSSDDDPFYQPYYLFTSIISY